MLDCNSTHTHTHTCIHTSTHTHACIIHLHSWRKFRSEQAGLFFFFKLNDMVIVKYVVMLGHELTLPFQVLMGEKRKKSLP